MMPDDLKSLIAELETAKEGGRRLDYGIARLLGRSVPRFVDIEEIISNPEAEVVRLKGGGVSTGFRPPRYTTSIDAALTLVPEGWNWQISDIGLAWVGTHLAANKPVRFDGDAATPALALCISALKARDHA